MINEKMKTDSNMIYRVPPGVWPVVPEVRHCWRVLSKSRDWC